MKISICLIIRDGENYMKYFNLLCSEIENKYKNIDFEYYIYENNSIDDTKQYIKNFAENRKCKYLLENISNTKKYDGINIERGNHMTTIRNKLKDFHEELDSDYTLLVDCDSVFLPETIEQLINSFNENIAMVTTFSICWDIFKYYKYIIHYYDTFALITDDNISYIETNNKCIFNSCPICKNYLLNSRNIKESSILQYNNIIKVKSAFGSLAMIKTDVYNKVKWGNSICEHHSFCDKVNKYGNIIINAYIKTITSSPGYPYEEYDIIKKELENFIINN